MRGVLWRAASHCIQFEMRHCLAAAVAGVLAVSSSATGQADSGVRVRGFAFDSLRGKPLADAFVVIVGGGSSTTSDARGRFAFERVPAGTYLVTLQHSTLDTLGFPGLSTRVRVTDGAEEVRIAVPSFPTLWRAVCGEGRTPTDSGFVYGIVRHATTDAPVANADITVIWHDSIMRLGPSPSLATKERQAMANKPRPVFVNPKADTVSRRASTDRDPDWARPTLDLDAGPRVRRVDWLLRGRSDSTGTYAVCGVPTKAHDVRVHAATATANSDSIDVSLEPRVFRRDLRIGPAAPGIEGRGTVAGVLSDHAGAPFPHARVIIAGATEARSNDSGRFVIRNVPAGTREVEVRFIGMTPAYARVEVVAGDSASVDVRVNRIPMLPGMTARAATLGRVMAMEFDTRRKAGLGYFVDSATIARYPSVTNVLREVPSLSITQRGATLSALVPDGRGGMCTPTVWLDGLEAGYGNLLDLTTSELVGLEVYVRPLTVPAAFTENAGEQKCGAILAWTKYLFRNR